MKSILVSQGKRTLYMWCQSVIWCTVNLPVQVEKYHAKIFLTTVSNPSKYKDLFLKRLRTMAYESA